MNKHNYILGTGLSHDGSSCLMKDGKIIVAIEKERITRKKHDGANDDLTIKYCLDAAGITFKDIDLIVQQYTVNDKLKPLEIKEIGSRTLPKDIPTITISHHIAHAYSAIGSSPFNDANIFVIDGQGSSLDTCTDITSKQILPKELFNIVDKDKYLYWENFSFYQFRNNKMIPIFKDFSQFYMWNRDGFPIAPMDMLSSIGEFYNGVSYFIFDSNFTEGKLMGLAPFGRPNILYFDAFDLYEGRAILRHDWMKNFELTKGGKYQCFSENFQYYADIAYWAQRQLEKALFYVFNYFYQEHPNDNFCYAGGVALNAVANSLLQKKTNYKAFYLQPAAGDNGLAIGCCYYGWCEYFQKEKIIHSGSTYFGKKYNNDSVLEILRRYDTYVTFEEVDDYCDETAKLLANQKVIGWFQGESEFGPRALGHRSILADPRRKDIKNFINKKIKSREDFRPFAPSILEEDLHLYFDCDFKDSPHMLLVAQAKKEVRDKIPAVVHKDFSARIQTVNKNTNPHYYKLIESFKKITGLPIILNTSFNGNEMPIVETPEDAIKFFIDIKNIDALVINNIIVKLKFSYGGNN